MTVSGGAPPARFSAARRRPVAQVPPSSTLASGSAPASRPSLSRTSGATRSRSATGGAPRAGGGGGGAARSDGGGGAALVRARRVGGVFRAQHGRVEEEPAVAIL